MQHNGICHKQKEEPMRKNSGHTKIMAMSIVQSSHYCCLFSHFFILLTYFIFQYINKHLRSIYFMCSFWQPKHQVYKIVPAFEDLIVTWGKWSFEKLIQILRKSYFRRDSNQVVKEWKERKKQVSLPLEFQDCIKNKWILSCNFKDDVPFIYYYKTNNAKV